jgi:thymidylate synthase (FAD)
MIIELYKDSKAKGYVELISYMGKDIVTPAGAARASFAKEVTEISERDIKLVNYCAKEKHTSIFEHNTLTFKFKVPLFVARQHMRHRTWSYNEVSRRYTSVDIDFYEPSMFRTQHKTNRQASNEDIINPIVSLVKGTTISWDVTASEAIKKHNEEALNLYRKLLDSGVCREQARMVLPQNLYTSYWATVNLNNLVKFIHLRDHEGAQQEIQVVARACKEIIYKVWPETAKCLFEVNHG